jgi:hypothetical protein
VSIYHHAATNSGVDSLKEGIEILETDERVERVDDGFNHGSKES